MSFILCHLFYTLCLAFHIILFVIMSFVLCQFGLYLHIFVKENTNKKKPKKKPGYPDSWTCGYYLWHHCGVMDLDLGS